MAVIVVAETTVNEDALVPPKITVLTLLKSVPVIVTVLPGAAVVGVNEVITGGGIKVNPALKAVPPGVITLISPVELAGTIAVMPVDDTTWNEVAATPPKVTE